MPTDLDLHCLLRQVKTCSAREGLKGNKFTQVLPSEKGSTPKGKNLLQSAPSEKGSTLKGKNLFPFRVDPFFRRGLMCRNKNRKLEKVISLLQNGENLPSSPSLHNDNIC